MFLIIVVSFFNIYKPQKDEKILFIFILYNFYYSTF